jgi:hypothetical protein
MFTAPDTLCQLARLEYQDRLRVGARGYLAAQTAVDGPRRPLRAMRTALGSVLVVAGQRLRGEPAPVLRPVAAGERSSA